jgi:hypothetical protein
MEYKFDRTLVIHKFSLQKKLDDNIIDSLLEEELKKQKLLYKKDLLITVRQYRMETINNYIVIEARLRFNEGEQ